MRLAFLLEVAVRRSSFSNFLLGIDNAYDYAYDYAYYVYFAYYASCDYCDYCGRRRHHHNPTRLQGSREVVQSRSHDLEGRARRGRALRKAEMPISNEKIRRCRENEGRQIGKGEVPIHDPTGVGALARRGS